MLATPDGGRHRIFKRAERRGFLNEDVALYTYRRREGKKTGDIKRNVEEKERKNVIGKKRRYERIS